MIPAFRSLSSSQRRAVRMAVALALLAALLIVPSLADQPPLQIPSVVAFEPDLASGIPAASPIKIQFSTAMDRGTVEKAFKITPEVRGEFSWQGNAVSFTPLAPGFKRGTPYTVYVDSSAQSSQQQLLPSLFEVSFVTADSLRVLSVQPFRDSVEVGIDSVITVQFNNPVVPLTTLDSAKVNPLTITPPIEGQGKWLTTSVYTFRPTAGLAGSTQYTVTVKKGIADTNGSILGQDYVWSFKTWAPAVSSVFPPPNSMFVGLSTPISVTLNQPIDRASFRERFRAASEDGREVTGTFAWPTDDVVVFTPARELGRGTRYGASIDGGLRGRSGLLGMADRFNWEFLTVDEPRLVSMKPGEGERVPQYTSLALTFNNPMDRASVLEHLEIVPKPTQVYSNWRSSDTVLNVSSAITQPSTRYRVTLKPGAADRFGQRVAEGRTVEFETAPLNPYISLKVPGMPDYIASLSTTGTPFAFVEAVNVESVKLTLSSVDQEAYVSAMAKSSSPQSAAIGTVLREWTLPAKGELNEKTYISITLSITLSLTLGPAEGQSVGANGRSPLPVGIYAVQIESPQVPTGRGSRAWYNTIGFLAVSRAVATVKATGSEALVWVVDQTTGEPMADADVKLYNSNATALATGKTDAKGLFMAKLAAATGATSSDTRILAVAEKDGDMAIASTQWNWSAGISPSNFNLPYRSAPPRYATALYTDRPIYRPGDKIYIEGVVRGDDDGRFSLLSGDRQASLLIRDPRYRIVSSQTLPLGEFGSFNAEFLLETEAATGNYVVQVGFDGDFSTPRGQSQSETYAANFLVAEFRKPEFEVKISTDKREYIQGDEVVVTVRADYFFGAPVPDAKVYWELFQKPYSFKGPGDADGPYSFSDYQPDRQFPTFTPGPRPIATGEGRTAADGSFTMRLPSEIAKETTGQVFTVEASITDANNQQVFGRVDAVVHKGTFYIGVRSRPRVAASGKAFSVEVITVDTQAITAPNKLVSLDLYEERWYSVQEKGPDGRLAWTSKVESTLVASAKATTNATGKATASFTAPKAGSYKVLATARDERGNETRSAAAVYASGREYVYWRVENHDRIDLIADKPSYKPGETAKVLVPSPFPKAKALLTIERGHIIEYKTIDVESTSHIVEIPITSAYVPNVYVSIVLLQSETEGGGKADYKVGYADLPVQAAEKKLTITITPDKQRYQPREKATYTIKTTDFRGQPVQAELSIALVDASVLSLAEEKVREMFDSFYGRRSLSVNTGQTLSKSLNKIDPLALGGGKGGGGDPGDARGFFPDVAYWNPRLVTDKNGEATVAIDLPDSLTTWRLTVRGTTVDTIVGTERNDILATKQVMVRPVVPRFLVVGDEARLEAIVHNLGKDTLTADVSLSAQGLAIGGQLVQKVQVPPSGATKVYWTAKAGSDKVANLVFRVQPTSPAGAPKDTVDVDLPILTYSAPEVAASSGEVRTTITETVQLPANIDRELAELAIKMEPSLASGMQAGLRYLEHYPYESIEHTISRFMPNIATLRALNKVGIENKELHDALPQGVSLAIQRLYRAQNPDGSWGWWPGEQGSPFITAYALYGLTEARREGFAVQPQVTDKAAGYLSGYLSKSRDVYAPEAPNERAYLLYVLAEAGKADRGTTVALYERRDSLGRYGRAYLALSLFAQNEGQVDSRVKNLIEDLNSSAIASAPGVHWEEAAREPRAMNTNNRTTAVVLDALVRIDPANPLIPGAVRWLMVARKEGRWETTQETATALIALSDYLAMSGELDPNYAYDVAVNGRKVGGDKVTKNSLIAALSEGRNILVDIPNLLLEEANKVRMARYPLPGEQTVKGKLYYSLYLRYFLPAQNITARGQGIVVSREYLDADGKPLKGAPLGNTFKVKLTVVATQDLHYVVVEDPLPAGAEAVDPALKTSSITSRLANADRWRFTHVDVRDEKVAFFATFLPKGTYDYTYLLRATTAGAYQVLPTTAYEMYFPEVWGRTAGSVFTINP